MDSNAGGLKDYGPCSASCDRPIVSIAPKTPLCSERTQSQNFGFDASPTLKSDEGKTVKTPFHKDSKDNPSCPEGTVRVGNQVFGGDVYCVPDSSDAKGKRHSEDNPACPEGTVRVGNRVFGGDVYCVPDSSDAKGKRHGPYRCWEAEFVGGRIPGWWEDGTLLIRGQYKNGDKYGVWTYWDQFGQKVKEETIGSDLPD